MSNIDDYAVDQAANIQVQKLYPVLIGNADIAHRLMQLRGHLVAGFEVSETPGQIAFETCVSCGLQATIEVRKPVGRDAKLLIWLPTDRCPMRPHGATPASELYWLPSETNDAPDGREGPVCE